MRLGLRRVSGAQVSSKTFGMTKSDPGARLVTRSLRVSLFRRQESGLSTLNIVDQLKSQNP